MPIVTVPTMPAGVTAFAAEMAAQVINAAWDQGIIIKNDLATKVGDVDLAVATADVINDTQVAVPSVTAPTVNIPASVAASDIYTEFGTQYLEIGAWLADKFTTFKSTHFPSNDTTYASVEAWVQGALTNPNAGIPLAVQSQILEDARAKISSETNRAKDAVLATFAARRFPMPSGAAASAVLQIEQKSQDDMAETVRKIMISSIEQMKFAVDKAIALRSNAMSATLDYIKVMASGQEMSSRLVGVGYDAQSKLISAASQFYAADTNAKEMISKVTQFNSTLALDADHKNQAAKLSSAETRVKALLAEVQALSQMSTSLFNNVHASTSVSSS